MSVKILSVTLLLLLVNLQASANRRLPHRRVSPCCTSYSTSDISAKVIGDTYRSQAAAPEYGCVEAKIFRTSEGSACANPNADWVKKLLAKMRDEKHHRLQQ